MPVTHGVAGSSPVQTALKKSDFKQNPVILRNYRVFCLSIIPSGLSLIQKIGDLFGDLFSYRDQSRVKSTQHPDTTYWNLSTLQVTGLLFAYLDGGHFYFQNFPS